jgi:acyl-CoA synthetase (NDP forming)
VDEVTAASPHPLHSLFAPRSVAIIGASREPSKIPGILLALLRKNGFAGAIYPVNPNYPDIDGLACDPSISAIGQPVDLAIVIIPARAVLSVLSDCAAAGVNNAIVISSGFGEEGGDGAAMQRAIADFAKTSSMRIMGPNAEGFFNEPLHIAATFSPTVDRHPEAPRLLATRKRIGIVAQSGGIGFAIYHRARALGVAVSLVVSTGNEADIGAGECLDYLIADDATDVIVMFIESIRDVDIFLAALDRAARCGKKVIVTKVGRSPAGERGAASHTASMAGWNTAYEAVFTKYGCVISNDLDEAVTIAATFASTPTPRGDRVAVLTVSGGAGIWAADSVALQGLAVPELSAPLQAAIRSLIPSYGSARNPVDITAQAVHSGGLQKALDLLEASAEVDIILVVISLSSETRIPFKPAELALLLAAQTKPIAFYSYTLPSSFARTSLAEAGVVILAGLTHVATGLRELVRRANFRLPERTPLATSLPLDFARLVPAPALSEFDSKTLLIAAGFILPRELLVTDKAMLDQAVAQLGFPLALKIQSRAIAHKSEIDGVRLGIGDRDAAHQAFDELIASAQRHRPGADIQGVLIAPMAREGVEIIIGTLQDRTFGSMLMVGFGGVATELYKDVVYRPAPVSAEEAVAMLDTLKTAPLLHGFRGAPKADVSALTALIAQVSQLAVAARDVIQEIDINPVLVHPQGEGVTIVDALVVPKRA